MRSRHRPIHKLLGRFASFSGLSLLSAVAPLIVLPAVARIGGVTGWAAVTVAQAVGAVAAVVVGLGFNTIGPARLSGLSAESAYILFAAVLLKRIVAYVVCAPMGALIAVTLVHDSYQLIAALVTFASATSGLSLAWFAIGIGRAPILAKYDAIPKLAASLIALGLVATTENLVFYPILIWLFTMGGLLFFWMKVRRVSKKHNEIKSILDWRAAACELAATCYVSAPLVLASMFLSVEDVSHLGSIDKLYRYTLYVVYALTSSTLAWVLEPGRSARERRFISVMFVTVGISGCLVLLLGGTAITGAMFGVAVAAPATVCLGYAIAYLCVASSTPIIQFKLIPVGNTGWVLVSTFLSAATGLSAMVILGKEIGVQGVAIGFGVSEFVGLTVTFLALLSKRRRQSAKS